MKYILIAVTVIAVIIASLFFEFPINEEESTSSKASFCVNDYPLCFSFIDVGQGDCSLVSFKGKHILIDGGESSCSSNVLDYLKENSVTTVDYYILTHPHSDHIGAASDIIDSIECKNVVMTDFSDYNVPTTKTFENMLDAIENNNCDVLLVKAGDSFNMDELTVRIFAPITESDDYNKMSIVCKISYSEADVLFTGDTEKPVERDILENEYDISADVLKVAHHGSSTSSHEAFIKAVSPEYAIISCGENNDYGHPHDETVNLLNYLEIEYYRTDTYGTIVYYGDGTEMNIGVYNDEIYS